MKTTSVTKILLVPALLHLLLLTGFTVGDEEQRSIEEITDTTPPDPLDISTDDDGVEDEEEQDEDKTKRGIGIHTDLILEAARGSSLAADGSLLPKAEALQGVPQTLQGLHIGRIPPTCAFCSRQRNLCRIISGIFTRSPLPYGYSLVTPIPAGVCNVSITEMKPSKNFFALRRPDGTYVLNGNWDIQAAGQYLIGGTTFTYTPSDEDSGEQLEAPGPLREPIELMLISQSPNPGIKYEYRVPIQEYLGSNPPGLSPQTGILPNVGGLNGARSHTPSTYPQGSATHGSRNPGQGASGSIIPDVGNQPIIPARSPYGPNNPNIVSGTFPSLNTGLNPAGGINRGRGLGSFNPSNVPQTGVGVKPRLPASPAQGHGTRGSSGIAGVIPHLQPITPLGTSQGSASYPVPWIPSFSSQDTGPISGGSTFSSSQSFPRLPSSGSLPSVGPLPGQRVTNTHLGDQSRPNVAGSGSSVIQASPPEFPQNSVPLRPIAISGSTGSRLPSSSIPSRPILSQSSELGQADPSKHRTRHRHGGKHRQDHQKGSRIGVTQNTPFGADIQQTQPNVPSESSTSNSTVKGSRRRNNGGRRRQHQNDSGATGGRSKGRHRKNRTRNKQQRQSRYQWAEKGFTPCSKSCGGGNQTTILSCERRRKKTVVADRRCNTLPRPKTHTIMCNLKPCPATWTPGEWGPCSVTCGMGVQTRPLECKQKISPTFTMMVPDAACLSKSTVSTSQVCEMERCPSTSPEWDTGLWSNCSAACGVGVRIREVRCMLGGRQVPNESCSPDSEPEGEQQCDMGSCASNTWFFSQWEDQCSESCGTGIQTRKVHCLSSSSDLVGTCSSEKRPEASRSCRTDTGCGGQWFVGPWEECSTSCGIGRESRSVICVIVSRKGKWRVVEEDQCTTADRPSDSQECNIQPCTPQWYTSDWSQCSVSCEGGVMRREVTCLDSNLLPSADCHISSKPVTREPCNLYPCTTTIPTISSNTSALTTTLYPKTALDNIPSEYEPKESIAETGNTAGEGEEKERVDIDEDGSQEIENELIVEKVTGNALNVIPDKDAQGDESVADEDEGELRNKEDKEAEEKKKRRKKTKTKGRGSYEAEDASRDLPSQVPSPPIPSPTDRSSCIDRIKNCHLVFRARLCRLKYYNKLCCRTCSTS